VPTVRTGGSKSQQIPLDKETLLKIKEKNSLSRKFVNTKDQGIRKQYNRVRNQVTKLTRKARKAYEHNLSAEAKTNPKRIWQYINSKSKTKQGIGELCIDPKDPKSEKTDDNEKKANILADFFSSVFTLEPVDEVPTLGSREITTEWSQIEIKEEEIKKHLKSLKPDN
jgi:hypothetical protein